MIFFYKTKNSKTFIHFFLFFVFFLFLFLIPSACERDFTFFLQQLMLESDLGKKTEILIAYIEHYNSMIETACNRDNYPVLNEQYHSLNTLRQALIKSLLKQDANFDESIIPVVNKPGAPRLWLQFLPYLILYLLPYIFGYSK